MPSIQKKPKTKHAVRQMRAQRARKKLSPFGKHRLYVHRTNMHIYCNLTTPDGALILASMSTLDPSLRETLAKKTGIEKAELVGKACAQKAITLGVKEVVFVNGGYKYHGRVKALADSARAEGLIF